VDKFQEYIRTEANIETRELLIIKAEEEHERLNIILSNFGGMEDMMGVAIYFLGSIKSQ